MGKNVLITGGTGFVGYWMRQTQPEGIVARYVGKDNYKSALDQDWTHIVHLAPISPAKVIKQAKGTNARLLYCSSGIVYYPDNNTEYRRNKLRWEKDCLFSGVDVVIARLFTFKNVQDTNKAWHLFHLSALANVPIHISGDGSTVRTYMSGREMGEWMWAILLKGKSGECYDVGSDKETTILELARKIIKDCNSRSEIIIEGGVDPMPHYAPMDTAKTKGLL